MLAPAIALFKSGINFFKIDIDFSQFMADINDSELARGRSKPRKGKAMDLYTHFTTEYRDQWIAGRLASSRPYGVGTGSKSTAMIAAMASGIRRISTRLENWARGTSTTDVPENLLPRVPSAR